MDPQKMESSLNISSTFDRAIDAAMEATVVPGFSRLGPAVRSRIFDWDSDLPRLDGSTAIVTGGTSGIGAEIASGLCRLGADVIITSRSSQRAESAAESMEENLSGADSPGSVQGLELDLGSFESIDDFVIAFELQERNLDILIHNGGALNNEYQTTPEGRELTVATHLIGPYLLTKRLEHTMSSWARLLWMSSGGMYTQKLDVDSLEMTEENYKGAVAYARAKRAQVELVCELAPMWSPAIIAHTVHPGWVDTPGVEEGIPAFGKVMGKVLRTPKEGADTMLWLASGAGGAEPGQFWHDRRPRSPYYLPWTRSTADERFKLVEWLELVTLPGTVNRDV